MSEMHAPTGACPHMTTGPKPVTLQSLRTRREVSVLRYSVYMWGAVLTRRILPAGFLAGRCRKSDAVAARLPCGAPCGVPAVGHASLLADLTLMRVPEVRPP